MVKLVSMPATEKTVSGTDNANIPSLTFFGDDGNTYKVVGPEKSYRVENGKIKIRVARV